MMKYNVAIWGTGVVYNWAVKRGILQDVNIVCYIDSAVEKSVIYENKIKYSPEEFLKSGLTVDYILIMNNSSEEIYKQCQNMKLEMERVIFVKNYRVENPKISILNKKQLCSESLFKIADLIQENYNNINIKINDKLLCSKCSASNNSLLLKEDFNSDFYEDDFFRYRTFELVADEIEKNNTRGSIAEIGVFRGDFSALLNAKFPERHLYLFDTFCSFDKSEFNEEIQKGRWSEGAYDYFGYTDVDVVLHKMKYPDKCIVVKGIFPESAKELDEQFAFVSLDVDLENSTYYSLEYMYPRLASGGYIFIHDYNTIGLDGIKEAIKRYETDYNITLCKVPIADKCGTLIIYKP